MSFICTVCKEEFKNKSTLTRHVNKNHCDQIIVQTNESNEEIQQIIESYSNSNFEMKEMFKMLLALTPEHQALYLKELRKIIELCDYFSCPYDAHPIVKYIMNLDPNISIDSLDFNRSIDPEETPYITIPFLWQVQSHKHSYERVHKALKSYKES